MSIFRSGFGIWKRVRTGRHKSLWQFPVPAVGAGTGGEGVLLGNLEDRGAVAERLSAGVQSHSMTFNPFERFVKLTSD